MKKKNGKKSWLAKLLACLTLGATLITGVCTAAFATGDIVTVGEMVDIKSDFAAYLVQDTVRVEDDGYVGAIQYTVYHNSAKGTIKTGYEGTPVVIYTINHPGITRVGTDSNKTIITSMLDRGYVVVVLDYLNNADANSTTLANSTQAFRSNLINDKIITYSDFPDGNPREVFVAPSGCNVLLNQVFWQIDKHSVEGTLEKIVENWNTDFRTVKGGGFLKWVHTDGTRKEVLDDTLWYNADKTLNAESGQYTYVSNTVATTITDCVDPDGSFIDMNLYMNIVYPTSPESEVPVMSLANSSQYPTTSVTGADLRPHSNGFLYEGYANVVFDYLFEPMNRAASWGYYDGSQGNTKDHMNYGLMMYNDKLVNTAAMRYLRYLSLSDSTKKYNFDLDAFGVYGNSKGGWFSYLGEEILQSTLVKAEDYATTAELEAALDLKLASLVPDRYYQGHDGTTRYQAGAGSISADGFTVLAGTMQPWLTYNGEEILSGAQLTNACNGSQEEDVSAGHVPIFISGNMTDTYNAAYSYSVNIYNICRELDIPLLHFEVPIGHTLTSGMDMNYNVDTYVNYFKYIGYFLKNEAIDIAYMSPMNNAGDTSLTTKIEIHFTGIAERGEVERITVTAGATVVSGVWEHSFGGTVWTFTPDELAGDTLYTVTVPADFKGDNGVAMNSVYTSSFRTKDDVATKLNAVGEYYSFTAPSAFTFGNSYVFRFLVTNDAANRAMLYAVDSTTATEGALIGSVNLRGMGSYEIDISDFIVENTGENVILMLKAESTVGDTVILNSADGSAIYENASKNSKVTFVNGATTPDGETAVSVYVSTPTPKPDADNPLSVYYDNPTHLFTYGNVMGGVSTSPENYGRRFTVSFDVYDTVSRTVQVKLNTMTKRTAYGTIDYNHVLRNVTTTANGWTHVEFTYEIYEPDYGFASDGNTQSLAVFLSPTGKEYDGVEKLAYINNLTVTETVTAITVGAAFLAECDDGSGFEYKAPEATSPLAIYNGEEKVGEYATLAEALAAYTSGHTIKLQSDYTLADDGVYSDMGSFAEVNIDLNGYTVYSENTTGAFLWLKATNSTATVVNVEGGSVLLGRTALISYADSSAAGSGKRFDVNLNNVYIGVMPNSWATELLSTSTVTGGVSLDVNIKLNSSVIDIPDASRAKDAATLFVAPATSTLKVNYTVTGGEIRLSSQRWITVIENAKIVEFLKDSGDGYTVLKMPESITVAVSGSYFTADGYARYEKASVSENIATYTLVCDDNSTRYGVITDTYADSSAYPFLIFKDGVLVGGQTGLSGAVSAAAGYLKGTDLGEAQVEILMRCDYVNDKEVSFGASNGTILIDLGGYTLTREKIIINAVVNSSTVFDYATGVIFTNGRIDTTARTGVIGATHCLTTTTNVKTFNITFDNITMGFGSAYADTDVAGAFWSIWQNGHTTNTITNLTIKDCTLDLETNAPTGGGTLLSLGTAAAKVNLKLLGGEIVTNGASYKVATTDSADTVTVGLGSESTLPTLKVATGGTAISDSFKTDAGDFTNFEKKSTEGSYDLYELTVNQNVTDYGIIPGEYEDAAAYPFALFMDGEFVGAYAKWKATTVAAGDVLNGNADKTAYVLVRSSYTTTSDSANGGAFNKMNGTLVVDLGKNTLTRGASGLIFDFYYSSGNTSPVNVVIKNGTLLSNGSAIFANQINAGTSSVTKKWNVTLDGVTLGFASGATKSGEAFWASWTNPTFTDSTKTEISVHCTLKSETKVTFNDCTLDLSTNLPANTPTLFDFSDNNSYDLMTNKLTINGGKIISTGLSSVNISTVNSGSDTVTFGKLDGKYTTLTTPTTAVDFSHYTGAFTTAEGTKYFIETADDGTNSTYELLPMTFGNMSATLTAKYFSAYDYPFFVFKDGVFSGAYESWRLAIDAAKSCVDEEAEASSTATIIARRDYDISKTNTAGLSDAGSNFNTARGKIVLDLNGYTMNNVDTYFIDTNVDYSTATYLGYASSLTVKNGTLKNSRGSNLPMIGFQHYNTSAADDTKEYNLVFNNVTFAFGTGAFSIVDEFPDKTGDGIIANYVFNDCIVDFANAASGAVAFDLKDNKTTMISSFTFNGGSVVASDLSSYILVRQNTVDTVVFAEGTDGKYMSLTQSADAAAPTLTYKNAAGTTLTFGKERKDGTNMIYRLGEPVTVKYGAIPFTYANPEFYPFVVFSGTGTFWGADDTFLDTVSSYDNEGIIHTAKDKLSSNVWDGTSYGDSPLTAIVLMRADYTMASNETYNNLAQILGEVTVDLDGHTLRASQSRVIFPTSVKPWGERGVFPTTITVKGGNIEIFNAPIINFEPWTGDTTRADDYVANKLFTYNFHGVTVKALGSATAVATKYSTHSGTPNAIANTFVNFTDSTVDLSGSTANTVNIFSTGNGKCHTTSTFAGGNIVGKSGFSMVDSSADTTGSFSFAKGTDGKLTTLTLTSGTAPAEEFDSTLGKLVFVARVGGYELVPVSAAGLNVKSSISLYSDLYLNVYVSKLDTLASFTLGGVTYDTDDFENLETKVIDNVTYYVVSIPLTASDALSDVKVTTSILLADSTTLDGEYTLNVVTYARKLLSTSSSEIEKTLMRDILSYLRAAYGYFNVANDAKLSEIDTILGTGYDGANAPAFTNAAVKPASGNGTKGATFILNTAPTMRFYLDGADADSFVFKQNGYVVPYTKGTDNVGAYVEVTTYAYGLAGNVSYTVSGTDFAGEFNLKSYYDYVNGEEYTADDKAELITLVERFQRYAESALAYRTEVLAGQ